MDIYRIVANIANNPLIPKHYRELRDYYERTGNHELALAFSYLIEHKFSKNDSTDNPHPDK
jgi:hypothetical protein